METDLCGGMRDNSFQKAVLSVDMPRVQIMPNAPQKAMLRIDKSERHNSEKFKNTNQPEFIPENDMERRQALMLEF